VWSIVGVVEMVACGLLQVVLRGFCLWSIAGVVEMVVCGLLWVLLRWLCVVYCRCC